MRYQRRIRHHPVTMVRVFGFVDISDFADDTCRDGPEYLLAEQYQNHSTSFPLLLKNAVEVQATKLKSFVC